jgi:hypothetical protein
MRRPGKRENVFEPEGNQAVHYHRLHQDKAIPETDPKKENEQKKRGPPAEAHIAPELEEKIEKIRFKGLETKNQLGLEHQNE